VSGMPAMPRMTDLPLCQEIQSKLLRNVLQIAADRHPFYSRVLDTPHWILGSIPTLLVAMISSIFPLLHETSFRQIRRLSV